MYTMYAHVFLKHLMFGGSQFMIQHPWSLYIYIYITIDISHYRQTKIEYCGVALYEALPLSLNMKCKIPW